jgi:hypothetical protein
VSRRDAAAAVVGLLVDLVELLVSRQCGLGSGSCRGSSEHDPDWRAGAGRRGQHALALAHKVGVVQPDCGRIVRIRGEAKCM